MKRYSARFKFEVALAAVIGDRNIAQIAAMYGVHASTVSRWKRELLKKGPEVFATESTVEQLEQHVADLERLLGQKEAEIARLTSLVRRVGAAA